MGSRSSSNSRQQTNNYSTSLAAQGDNNGFMTVGDGNQYNITTTDGGLVDGLVAIGADMSNAQIAGFDMAADVAYGAFDSAERLGAGAFDLAADTNAQMAGVVSDGFAFAENSNNQMSDLAMASMDNSAQLAGFAIAENGALVEGVNQLAGSMLADSQGFMSDTFNSAMYSVDNANNRIADMTALSITEGNDLARDFATGSADLALAAMDFTASESGRANDEIMRSHRQALDFVDDMSRSDGHQLAENTNKTMLMITGFVVAGFALVLIKGKK